MNLIRAALAELSDLELAYFVTFTSPKLDVETQEKIQQYLEERNLNKNDISALILGNEEQQQECDSEVSCPNCEYPQGRLYPEELTEEPTWLSYSDLITDHNYRKGYNQQTTQLHCPNCNTKIHENRAPQPSVAGVRVFSGSLRS